MEYLCRNHCVVYSIPFLSYYFYCSSFYSIYLLCHFNSFFFWSLRYIRIRYSRIHEQPGYAEEMRRLVWAFDIRTRKKNHFVSAWLLVSHEKRRRSQVLSSTLLPWGFHACDRILCTVCFLHTPHQQQYNIYVWLNIRFVWHFYG